MDKRSFFDRVKALCRLNNTTIEAMMDAVYQGECEKPRGVWDGWRARGNLPRGDDLLRIARFLDVTMEYLVSGENSSPPVDFCDKYFRYADFLRVFDLLSDADRALLFSVAQKMSLAKS